MSDLLQKSFSPTRAPARTQRSQLNRNQLIRRRRASDRAYYGVDLLLILGALTLAVIGIVMIYTATRGALIATGLSPTYFLKRQAIWVFLGVVAMIGFALFDYRKLEYVGMASYGLSIVLLLAVLVPGLGKRALGSQRWFSVGPLQIQPSEFAVLALIIALATYCSRRAEGLTWRDVFKVLLLGAVPIGLVILQPDLGTGIIMAVIMLVMLAVAGLPTRILVLLLGGAALVVVVAVASGVLHHYQITRISSFVHQDATHLNATQQKQVYNLQQSKDAIGSGGLWGTGIGHGTQTTLGYVPEEQTDFIFAAVGEELGFFGSVMILGLLALVAWRVLRAAQLARDTFGQLLCTGVFALLAFSTFQNAGMAMGIMPITGIPLPFLSYGGSAVLVFFIGIGITADVFWRRAS